MPLPPLPRPRRASINFAGYQFSFPVLLTSVFNRAIVRDHAGVYAILVFDPQCTPQPYRVIYFGEAKNLTERITRSHERYFSWRQVGGSHLYISFYGTTSALLRKATERHLIQYYRSECNITHNQNAAAVRALNTAWNAEDYKCQIK